MTIRTVDAASAKISTDTQWYVCSVSYKFPLPGKIFLQLNQGIGSHPYHRNTNTLCSLLLLLSLLRLFVRRPQMRYPAVRKCCCLYTMGSLRFLLPPNRHTSEQ